MPTYIEYDKTTKEVTRVFASPNRPRAAGHVAYLELPQEIEPIDMSSDLADIISLVFEASKDSPIIEHWFESGSVAMAVEPKPKDGFLDA